MGGEESEIVSDTASVLFECAAFERANNRVTARKLGVRTEASGTIRKGRLPRYGCCEALERACMLVNMLECGDVVPGVFDELSRIQSSAKTIEAQRRSHLPLKRRARYPAMRWKRYPEPPVY